MADRIQQIEAAEAQIETPYDAGDPQQVNERRKKVARKKADRMRVWLAIMQQPDCRKLMFDMLDWCHIHGYHIVEENTHMTYFKLGEENIGKRLMAELMEAAPKEYLIMLDENK